ncbi:MAG: restriction endonuclease subunit S [Terrimicrobiaceae bacterium]
MSSKAKTIATKEEARPALVPKLRFPEFRGAPGWEQKNGNHLFDQINDRNPEPGLPVLAITQEHGAIPRHMIDYHVSVTEKSIESYKVVQVGDFIISLRSFQGGIENSQYHGICSPAYVILRKRGEGIDAYFKHYLKTDRFIQILTKNLEGLRDGKMVSYAQFSELLVPVPSPAEQQKIAECLSSVDELIAAQARKVDALKTHKKGLMQQLFPREGETQPRLRFPEFRGEWNDASLGDLCFSVSSGKDARDSDGAFDLYGSTGVIGKTVNASYDTPHILVARVGANAGHLTKASGRFGVTDNTLVIRPKPTATIDYIFHYLGNININKLIFGSGQPLITGSILKAQRMLVPAASEQSKISTCLSSIDDLINAESDKLEALKAHKKGLMQQLFPLAEEVER